MSPAPEPQSEEPDLPDDRKSWLILGIAAVIVIGIFVGILSIRQQPVPETIEELHAQNLQGKLPASKGYLYNGYSFVRIANTWFTQITWKGKVYSIPLHFGPRDLVNVSIDGWLSEEFGVPPFIMTFDPEDRDLGYIAVSWGELGVSLTQIYGITPEQGCTRNVTAACSDAAIGACDLNGTVFYFRSALSPRLILNNTCAIIEGDKQDLIRSADRLLLVLYGVMGR